MTQAETVSLQHRLTAFFGISIQIIGVLFLARVTVDTGTRMVYPFIPQVSAGLNVTVVGLSWLIFIRALSGMVGPIFGLLADHYGRRIMMAVGLLCQSIGVIGLALSQQWWATLPMIFYGLTLAAFIPAEQAYISDRVAYHKRGRALATIEFSWALAGIVSLPVVGWMIDSFGWQVPFFIEGLLSLIGAALVWFGLPATETRSQTKLNASTLVRVWRYRNVLASMAVGLLLFVGIGTYATVWSIWLTADFSLTAVTLGLIATVIGIAELGGSGLSSLFIDRIGKKRGSQAGLLLAAMAFMLLPLTQANLYLAVVGLVGLGLFLEFTVVSLIPLYSEQVPDARATVFSLVALGISVGVACGSPLAASLWEQFGLWAVSIVAAACFVAAFGLTSKYLKEEIDLGR